MSAELAEKTEVLKDRVRAAEGYSGRYIIPVVVPNQSMVSGPWARRAAEAYAKGELRMVDPSVVVPPPGVARPYPAYVKGVPLPHHLGRTSLTEFRQVAAEDAAVKAAAGADLRWVVEIHVDGSP